LKNRTGLSNIYLQQFYTFGDPEQGKRKTWSKKAHNNKRKELDNRSGSSLLATGRWWNFPK
jgi:hypothetical protein